jgi:hypothetical protein
MFAAVCNWFLTRSTIDKEYFFNGDLKQFEVLFNGLQNKNIFGVSEFNKTKFLITDKYSIGTMIINFRAIRGITVYGTIKLLPSDQLIVRLRTKIRIEIYFFSIISVASLVAMVININKLPFWPFLFPLVTIPWFNWIYMIQNKDLIERIRKYFNLKQ